MESDRGIPFAEGDRLGSGRRHQRGGPTTRAQRSRQPPSALRPQRLRPCPSRAGGSTSRLGGGRPHGGQTVCFARGVIRWLGMWLDSALTLRENQHQCASPARPAKAKPRHLVSRRGIPPTSARNLRMAIVRGTRKGMEGEHQAAMNCMGRVTLGVFLSTPLGIVAAGSCLTLARALLDYEQARCAQHLLVRPRGHTGPEEVITRQNAPLTVRLRKAMALYPGEKTEEREWGSSEPSPDGSWGGGGGPGGCLGWKGEDTV